MVLGLSMGVALWLWSLPRPPEPQPPLPVATGSLPNSTQLGTNQMNVGYDVYLSRRRGSPTASKDTQIPFKRAFTSIESSGSGGSVGVHETLWVLYEGKLYQFAEFSKRYATQSNRSLVVVKTLAIDQARMVTVKIQYPEIDVDETFGPFRLP